MAIAIELDGTDQNVTGRENLLSVSNARRCEHPLSSRKNKAITGRQCWAEGAPGKDYAIQKPERRPSRARFEKHVVGLGVAIKIGGALEGPTRW